jgi:serine/threonine-protein kinase RsbW
VTSESSESSATSESSLPDGDRVEIRIPADGAYVATLRMCAASLAARCDLTVDDIEDLRLAVDEACALLLPHAAESSGSRSLEAAFTLSSGELRVDTRVRAAAGAAIDRTGFAWTVLGALASSVDVGASVEWLTITLTKRREAARP